MSGRPLDVLEATVDESVTVRLKSGETYTGTLTGYDQHMNLVLESVTTAPAGDTEPEDGEDTTIIRGDNVVSITP